MMLQVLTKIWRISSLQANYATSERNQSIKCQFNNTIRAAIYLIPLTLFSPPFLFSWLLHCDGHFGPFLLGQWSQLSVSIDVYSACSEPQCSGTHPLPVNFPNDDSGLRPSVQVHLADCVFPLLNIAFFTALSERQNMILQNHYDKSTHLHSGFNYIQHMVK